MSGRDDGGLHGIDDLKHGIRDQQSAQIYLQAKLAFCYEWPGDEACQARDVHADLDIIGLIPGLGEPADIANAVAYAAEGDYGNAIISGAAAIPGFGWAATFYRWARRATTSRILLRSPTQLQSKFKHAADFGVKGNYNKANAAEFSAAIHRHINARGTQAIQGTYHGDQVTHYLDPTTGLNVISRNGEFVSGWRLSPAQLTHVLRDGSLGGG